MTDKRVPAAPAAIDECAPIHVPGADRLILIVDDDPAARAELRRHLAADPDRTYRFLEAATAAEALANVRTVRPDLVLLDDSLPDVGGPAVLDALAGADAVPPCAVIVMTEPGKEAAAVQAVQRGALDYLAKGRYDVEHLRRAVADAVDAFARLPAVERRRMPDVEQLRAEARGRADALAEAERRKDEFLTMLAHELRNPLAALRSAIDLLRGPDGDAAWAAGILDHQVRHMGRMVDDLLDVSRLTRGQVDLRKTPVDLRDVVARAVETIRPQVEARRHTLTVATPAKSLLMEADPTRLEQVVANLLHNAAKYTPEGGQIDVTATAAGALAVVAVRDNGVGITSDILPHVFDLFAQADRSLERAQGGLGIGLTLVKRLVELHGGRVGAHSPGPGRGAEFVVQLPLCKEEGGKRDESGGASNSSLLVPPPCFKKVLVVDDNVYAAEGLAKLLRLHGHTVAVAFDGPGGLAAARADRPDVVFLDIGLPGLDGYEVARRLRVDVPDGVTLVALTGYGQDADRRRARAAGFDHYLVKPAEPDELRRLLEGVNKPAGG